MGGKILTPIGFLIDLLDVSIKDMAQTLYVDRTTICKWKANDRHFSVKSDCFDKVVDYFLLHNSVQKRHILENLFSNLYGEVPYRTKDYLKSCMQKFLSHSVVPVEAQSMLSQMKGNLYMTMAGIYAGVEGRKSAMDILLTEAENQEKPGELIFFDRQTCKWCIYDEKYFREWHRRIKRLLDLKWQIYVILDCSSNQTDALSALLALNQHFYTYVNYHEYNFNSVKNINLLPTVYGLKGKMVLFGYNHGKDIYTSVFKDKFTVNQGYEYLKNLISECEATFIPQTQKQRIEVLQRITKYELIDEPSYLVSTRPSIITLGDDMLQQILRDNGVIGDIKAAAIEAFSAIKRSIMESKLIYRHILYDISLSTSASYEKLLFTEASYLLGRDIYISKEQFREHLRRTAHFILEHNNYVIAIPHIYEPLPSANYCFRCKHKIYAIGISELVRFNAESSIVNCTFSLLDDFWKRIPTECKNSEIIAQRLLRIANS